MQKSEVPLKNVREFLGKIRLWQSYMKRHGMDDKWCKSVAKTELRIRIDLFVAIDQEIKDVSFQNGKGTERAIQFIQRECEDIREFFFSFQGKNKVLNRSLGLNQTELQRYCGNLSPEENQQYNTYAMLSSMFFDFLEDYNYIIELSQVHESTNSAIFPHNYPHIFVDQQSYRIFENIHNHFSKSRNQLACYSFVYRKMIEDGYIHSTVKDTAFRQWLSEEMEIDISKTKTIDKCSTQDKLYIYQQAKELQKQRPNQRER